MAWVNRQYYTDMTTADQENNVSQIYAILSSFGWTMNAVAGICGCIQRESRFNPWTWQKNKIQSTAIKNLVDPRGRAYGLIQWDSCNNYILAPVAMQTPGYGPNFSDQPGSQDDGFAQLTLINTGEGYYPRGDYSDLKFNDYKTSTAGADYLAAAWLYNRQRPKSGAATEPQVRENGLRWFEYLSGSPTPPDPDTYIITTTASPIGGGTTSGGGIIKKGESVTLMATPNPGYTFLYWRILGSPRPQNPVTFTPTDSGVCTAVFSGGGGEPLPTPIYQSKMPLPLYLKHRPF